MCYQSVAATTLFDRSLLYYIDTNITCAQYMALVRSSVVAQCVTRPKLCASHIRTCERLAEVNILSVGDVHEAPPKLRGMLAVMEATMRPVTMLDIICCEKA